MPYNTQHTANMGVPIGQLAMRTHAKTSRMITYQHQYLAHQVLESLE
jgi:hypothetical protein